MAEGAVPAATRAGTAPFRSIGELAELCGHCCWVERRIFEVTGSRASRPEAGGDEVCEAEIRVVLSQMSAAHGFLSGQWRDRLPVRAGVDAEALVVPPPGPAGEVLDLIASEPPLARVLETLAQQFLPWLRDGYDRNLALASPVSEAPVCGLLEWATLTVRREIRLGGLLLDRLAPAANRAAAGGNSGPLVQRLLGSAADTFPGARAS
jgi:hypothetical protein